MTIKSADKVNSVVRGLSGSTKNGGGLTGNQLTPSNNLIQSNTSSLY